MLDLSVNDGKIKKAEKFTYDITKNVMKMEPDTVIYQYYFDSEEKVFLYEVYKSNEAAIEHVKNFRGSKWESKGNPIENVTTAYDIGEDRLPPYIPIEMTEDGNLIVISDIFYGKSWNGRVSSFEWRKTN